MALFLVSRCPFEFGNGCFWTVFTICDEVVSEELYRVARLTVSEHAAAKTTTAHQLIRRRSSKCGRCDIAEEL